MHLMLLHKLPEDLPEYHLPPQKLIAHDAAGPPPSMARGGALVPVRSGRTVEYQGRRSTFKEVLLRQEHHPPPSTGASRCC